MRVGPDGVFHLTYCTNIHPGNGWSEVLANLQRYAPALKARLAPEQALGIGLRLSGAESNELLEGDRLQQLAAFLREHDLYVFTLNGFPYGPFHGQPVKAAVHAPDWRAEERVQYTLRLIRILAFLLPEGLDGGISTSPLSYKLWVDVGDAVTWSHVTRNIARVAEALVRVRQEQGKVVHLDIEPEPDGLLANNEELIQFYTTWLLEDGARMLAAFLGVSRDEARDHMREHIRVCLDTCHMAVAYEDPIQVLDHLAEVGIKVGKVQISSALKVVFPADAAARVDLGKALQSFAESTYLHQVIQLNRDGTFRHYPDLIDALPAIQQRQIAQWRIHFHVPIFIDRLATFASTQDTIVPVLDLLSQRRFSRHLEIETYTWSVLPADLKRDLLDSITREFAWVLTIPL
jgi:hypothetical protein